MSLFVLDTDALTLLMRGQAALCRRVADHDAADLAVTIVTVEETLTGWYAEIRRAKRDDRLIRAYTALQQAVEFCGRARVLPFDAPALARFHKLRPTARRAGTNDLRIAAIVLTHEAVLITRNVADFKGLAGLQVEDWSVA